MKYSVSYTKQFEKQLKLCHKRGLDIELLTKAISILEENGSLPQSYKPHKLKGVYSGLWECHLKPDWLLVWEQKDNELILVFIATGTHSDLF